MYIERNSNTKISKYGKKFVILRKYVVISVLKLQYRVIAKVFQWANFEFHTVPQFYFLLS